MRTATEKTCVRSSRNLVTIAEKQRVDISCPDLLAEGARFETPTASETIGPDLTASVLSQPCTKARAR